MSRTKTAAEAWGSMLRAQAVLVPEMDRWLVAQTGLPLRWYDVLLELNAGGVGRLTMGELADRVVLSRSRVSRVVDELEAAGLIRRETNADDRRSYYASITAAGVTRFRSAAPVYRRAIVELFASEFTDTELASLRDLLARVAPGTSC